MRDLMHAADAALYRAKGLGRDRAVVASVEHGVAGSGSGVPGSTRPAEAAL
jgi:hypothetical protein